MLNSSEDFFLKKSNNLVLSNLIILVTNIGCDCETRRNRYTNEVHFRKVCALTTKQVSHVSFSFSLTVTEGIDTFLVFHNA